MVMKILLQLKYWISIPPKKGPVDSPIYTAATLMPMAFPRSWSGKAEVKIAIPVVMIMAAVIPWMILKKMSISTDGTKADRNDAKVSKTIPQVKIFFLP